MREWMEAMRRQKGLKLSRAAQMAGCSMELLKLLEDTDTQTLPSLALQIARVYGMSQAQCRDIGKAIAPLIPHRNPLLGSPIEVPDIEADWLFYTRLRERGDRAGDA